jgi:hypothetical protein
MDVLDKVRDIVLMVAGLATIFKVAYDIKENERQKKEKSSSDSTKELK